MLICSALIFLSFLFSMWVLCPENSAQGHARGMCAVSLSYPLTLASLREGNKVGKHNSRLWF